MSKLELDEKGFTCACGTRNNYPAYVDEHRNVRVIYTCSCDQQYILYRGTVQKIARNSSEIMDSEAFGD
ncbi:MAG: hypothetical protein NDI77_07995 [Geobacteraceae bacterium]|nr:hypothetical protein [Geobacteraceae bacterium]